MLEWKTMLNKTRNGMNQQPAPGRSQPYQSIYQLALEHIDTGVWVIDDGWRLIYLNRVMEQMTNRHRSNLIGTDIVEEQKWFLRGAMDLRSKIEEVKESGSPIGYENISYWRGLEVKLFQRGTIYPLKNRNGDCRGVMVTVEEVNETVKHQLKIERFERVIRAIKTLQVARDDDNQFALAQILIKELSTWRSVDMAHLYFVDSEDDELAIKIGQGILIGAVPNEFFGAMEDVCREVAVTGKGHFSPITIPGQSLESAIFPITIDDSIVAVVSVARKGRPYSEGEIDALNLVCEAFTTVFHEQLLSRDNKSYEIKHHMVIKSATEGLQARHLMQRRENQVDTFNQLSRTSHGSFNLSEMLTRSLDTVVGVLGWETAAGIYLLERSRDMLVLVAHRNMPDKACCKRTEIPLDFGACGLCARTGELIVLDSHTSGKMCRGELSVDSALTIAVPLKVRTEVLGVMFLYPEVVFHMSTVEREILKTLGEQLGMTIKNIELQHKITELSTIDEQTGAYNFRRFIEQVQTEYQRYRRYEESFTIISILYEMAHPQSGEDEEILQEQLLKATTETLKKSSRATDTIYRYGKHEFAVLLPATGKNGATAVIARLKASLTQVSKRCSAESQVRIGIGSVSCPEDTKHEMELIDHASKLARTELATPVRTETEAERTAQRPLEERRAEFPNNLDRRES